jgi:hypothetical protein
LSDKLYIHPRDYTKGFEELAAFDSGRTCLGVMRAGGGGAAERYFGEYVSGNYFTVFGIHTVAGRVLSADDDNVSAPPVAVMSYRAWRDSTVAIRGLSERGSTSMLSARAMGNPCIPGRRKFTAMKNVPESLAGRAYIVELERLSFAEIREARPRSQTTSSDDSVTWIGRVK